MSDGSAPHSQQPFQHGSYSTVMDGSSHLSHNMTGDMDAASSSSAMMDASQLSGFDFPYDNLSGEDLMMSVSDSTQPAFLDASSNAMSQNDPATLSGAGHDTRGDTNQRRNSQGSSDHNSPDLSTTLEDGGADDFGFSGQKDSRADGTDLGGRPADEKGDAPPAWSELKTKAGKERKRLPLACIACRRKKIRCSGEKPACKHCLRSRIPCVYKVTTRKAAPRTDYMAMLDKRLKRMEERIIKVVPKSEQGSNVSAVTRAVVKPAIPGSLSASKAANKKRNADQAFGPDIEAWARAPAKSTLGDDHRPTSLQIQEAEETQLFSEGTDALPTKDVQEHLAEVFFENIYGQAYHLLHKPSYMRKLRNNTLPPVLVLSVCAIAARFTTSPKFNSSTSNFLRGEEWASRARDICTRRYEWPNITILTCLLILGLHEFGTCQGGRSWALGGQAIRMAFALQLHKDLEYDPMSRNGKAELSFVDREIRRRVMWACFLMDRFNSSGTDRPMFIKEETIKIPLPVTERNFQLDMPSQAETLDGRLLPGRPGTGAEESESRSNIGVAAYMIRSIALWGRIISYLNQGGKEMDSHPMWSEESGYSTLATSADKLLESLPDFLQYSSDNLDMHRTENTANQFLLLHISVQQNMLFLHRAAVTAARQRFDKQAPDEFVRNASGKTYAAANRISDIIRDSEDAQCSVTAPFAGYCAFSATTMHILGIFSDNAQIKKTAETNAGINIKFLRKLMKYWGMFHWMVENIRAQYRAALDASRAGTPALESKVASPILQYGDWFDRYPHGVSDADFMDPAVMKKREKGADGVLEQKPELQSVEEFFETLSPQSGDGKAASRSAANAKRGGSRKSGGAASKASRAKQDNAAANTSGRPSTAQQNQPHAARQQQQQQPQQQQHNAGNHRGSITGVPMTTPLTAPAPAPQNAPFNTLSPISPVQMNQLSQNPSPQQALFPSNMLSMNLAQHSSGIMQPLDRQLVFGGYSMDPGNISTMQNMMNGMGNWNGAANNGQPGGGMRSVKDNGGGNNFHGGMYPHGHPSQGMPGDMSHMGGGGEEASSAWFMPFNMEPPEVSQDMSGSQMGQMDPLAGVFGNNDMGNHNQHLGGLQQGPG